MHIFIYICAYFLLQPLLIFIHSKNIYETTNVGQTLRTSHWQEIQGPCPHKIVF